MWYYAIKNQQQGPTDLAGLRQLWDSGQINAETLVWREGMSGWTELKLTELAAQLAGGVAVTPPGGAPAVYVPAGHSREAQELVDIMKWYWVILALPVVIILLLWKGWEAIQDGHPRTTPYKAVLYNFIPLFNFYWIFISIRQLAADLNHYSASRGLSLPRVDEGIATSLCIFLLLCLLPFTAWFAGIVVFILAIIFGNQVKHALVALYDQRAANR
jgi:hypothetical protein